MKHSGALDDIGHLRQVLLRKPAGELGIILNTGSPRRYLWHDVPDEQLAQLQHELLSRTLYDNGVSAVEITGQRQFPNLCFCRDQIVTLPDGVLLAKCSASCRRGEVDTAARALLSANVDVIPTVQPCGPYEGGDFILAGNGILLAGCSGRTSLATITSLQETLFRRGVRKIIPIDVPASFLHLDCALLPIGNRRIISAIEIKPEGRIELEALGFRIITIPEEWTGPRRLGLNVLFVSPGRALVSDGADGRLLDLLREEGIQTVSLPVNEFEKGGGGLHCLVATISRSVS